MLAFVVERLRMRRAGVLRATIGFLNDRLAIVGELLLAVFAVVFFY